MPDPRKPLFPDDDERDPVLPEPLVPEEEAVEIDAGDIIETLPEERFPPLDPTILDMPEEPEPPRRQHTGLLNLATVVVALATLVLLAYFSLLWVNPYHPLNPLPPYTPLPHIITTTPLPATITPIPTQLPTQAATVTFTPIPADTLPPAPTFTPAPFPFTLLDSGVTYAANTNESGCDWLSIAGNVSDLQGEGLVDYSVRIRSQEGDLNATIATGSAPDFGSGGFELKLADQPDLAPYIVQLLNPGGEPVSEEYLIVTSDTCEQNIALVSFVQNR